MCCGCVQQDFGEKWHGSPSDISHILQLSNLSRLKEFETVEDQRHIAWITIAQAFPPPNTKSQYRKTLKEPLRTLSHNGAATITCWTLLDQQSLSKNPSKTIKASVKTSQLQCFWIDFPNSSGLSFCHYAVLLSHIQPQTNKTADLCPALGKHNDSSNLSKRRKNLSLSPPVPSWVFR